MKYGLIGQNISYSYSKIIHNLFGNNEYELYSLNSEEVKELLVIKNFKGINVTIPYKEMVIPYLDYVDESVKSIGACNLIVNKNGKLYGYNSDYYGFLELIKKENFIFKNQNIAILGSGGTSKTVKSVLENLDCKNIYIISRSNKFYRYDELEKLDIDIIINTTPVGGINDDSLICDIPSSCNSVIDVIYRPMLTKLLMAAKDKKIKYCNGLYMLVYQAYLSHLKFFDEKEDKNKINEVYVKLNKMNTNIYLIGMPYSGKTSVGKYLAYRLNKHFIDIDEEIVKDSGMSIDDIFKLKGELYFRELESKEIKRHMFDFNSVISLGGGAILKEENMLNCLQTGEIYLIKRDIDKIIFDESRPLTSSIEQYKSLFLEREKLYNKYSSKEYYNNSSLEEIVEEMECDFNETFNS